MNREKRLTKRERKTQRLELKGSRVVVPPPNEIIHLVSLGGSFPFLRPFEPLVKAMDPGAPPDDSVERVT